MSDIQSLILRVERLSQDVDWWNSALIWALVFAAVTAVAVVVTTRMALVRAKQLADTQEAVIRAKDKQLTLDLKGKDERIAELEGQTAAANERTVRLRTDLERSVADSRSKQTELEVEQRKTAQAQKEAAEAQLALKQYVDLIAAKAEPRSLDLQRFLEHLKGKPRGTADIWYKPEDTEAYLFAGQIGRSLGTGAGWNVSKPKPIPLGGDSTIPSELKYGGSSGLTVRGNKPAREFGENTAIGALMEALLWGRRGGGAMVFIGDSTLPDDHFIIIVGQQQ